MRSPEACTATVLQLTMRRSSSYLSSASENAGRLKRCSDKAETLMRAASRSLSHDEDRAVVAAGYRKSGATGGWRMPKAISVSYRADTMIKGGLV